MSTPQKRLDEEDAVEMARVRHPNLRPVNAGTMLIVDRDGVHPRILMGRRHGKHRFLPGKYVFPGGRVDPGDSRITPHGDFRPSVALRLEKHWRGRFSQARAKALALAAIRETFEETGLLIGRKTDAPPVSRSPAWQDFFDRRVVPDLGALSLIARAITPPGRPRRFDARFFVAETSDIAHRLDPDTVSDELLELEWLTFEDARDLDLAHITRIVIDEIERRIKSGWETTRDEPVPFYYMVNGTFRRETI